MKRLSILIQVSLINILVMAIFMIVFISQNYLNVSKQLNILEDEKIDSIIKTLEPLISINLSLDLKENYISAIGNVLKNYQEITSIELLSEDNQIIYKNERENIESFNPKSISIKLNDSLLKTPIGTMIVNYTFSNIYIKILNDFKLFLFYMFILFIFSLIISTIFMKQNLNPLKILKEKMLRYSFNDKVIFEEIAGKNEIAIINNSAKQMIERVEKELETRILYEKEIMNKNRLASQGEMLDNIAHQWRQPLMKINAILLNIDRMSELNKLEKKYLAQKIMEASDTVFYMSETIEVFREFVNPNKSKEKFELTHAVHQAIKFLNTSVDDIKISFKYEKEYEIKGMKNELIQVLISLLTNTLEVFESRAIEKKEIKINIFKEEYSFVITIEDTAGGIKEDLIEKIFDPYVTTKYKSGGTGMGLYIAKIIMISSFKGDISVVNTNLGAKFIIVIPKGEKN